MLCTYRRGFPSGFLNIRSLLLGCALLSSNVVAEDWTRFRGENGSGVAADAKDLPTKWSDHENLGWKAKLPGPGSSSPIVVGDKVFVTCWSGYGTPDVKEGKLTDLKRHLVCVDRVSGNILWDKSVPAVLPEDQYGGMFAEHGYASHTPTTDGSMVFAFFGKSGVFGFDLDGNQKWEAKIGDGLDRRGWGSACSPVLYKDKVIVLAAVESQTLYAFDKLTGKLAWKKPAPNFESTWGTPILVQDSKGKTELAVGVPGEIWGFNPEDGGFLWYCAASTDDGSRSSIVSHKDVIYSFEGRSGTGVAVRSGGLDDASQTNLVWKNNERNGIGTPLVVDGKIFLFSNKIVNCLDASTGKQLFQERLPAVNGATPQVRSESGGAGGQGRGGPGGEGGQGRGGPGGRRGGGMGGQDYGSPVAGDGKVFYVTRGGDMHVLKIGPTFEHLGVNRVTDQPEDFSSTPAIVGNQIFVRSSVSLYCISKK